MEMTRVSPTEIACEVDDNVSVELKKPKRILYFSDGTLEEFSDSEEGSEKMGTIDRKDPVINESDLQWGPWILRKTVNSAKTILAGCDYAGEALASFLGITTPKYEYEIEEFRKIQEENIRLEQEKKEASSWQEATELNPLEIVTEEPYKSNGRF